ncbi:acetyl esterase/lipase [Mycolicibacterium sp. BK556]|uniref:alpha/beta hydrolase n=1 Tax=Mycobacteriaceae TaxID=1762 RepID=UPI000D3A9763|nr:MULTISPECIES: alpha/beta hydrolase [Mycobacteriaceae]MBB3606531.1 acetyl esterase/lipase [Mycolicibacterium sp. BK556]MBB3636223.1 acetyl esterase/lipase [Mycolicibacterium sp. BK607]MBB3753515.1 acetyl esterase/lipase [Mycolicibacterium sp. BK634]TDO06366.1 acetyl esterase/lipase [Mycobacterium sp. BK086]
MPGTDFHPDLRRLGRFLPKQVVTPRTYRLIRFPHRILARRTPSHIKVVKLRPGVSVRVFVPALTSVPCPALLWIHSGGYVIGTAALDDKLCARFASELGAVVAAVDYRLAPENPYPAALYDCYAALTWLAQLSSVDPGRIAVGGASAGGGLAAALALLTRDRGGPSIRAQLLVYPMLDDRTADRPEAEHPKSRLWSRSSNGFGWHSYLGDTDPNLAVPARRTDLAGLAPAWIGVGDLDLFHDEDLAYAEQLKDAGVPCEVTVVPGAFHGFDAIQPKTRVARSFFDSQCAMLRLAFTPK